jgi:Rieske Fe-S protein
MLAAAVLVGCGSGDASTMTDADNDTSDGGDETGDETGTCTSTPPGVNVGAETAFPVGTWNLVMSSSTYQDNVIVAQDANGFFAFSAICTHAGCIVDAPASNGAIFCGCHGSRFDGNGNVTGGPAQSPLQHFAIAICNGNVYVDPSSPVSEATRTPPQ